MKKSRLSKTGDIIADVEVENRLTKKYPGIKLELEELLKNTMAKTGGGDTKIILADAFTKLTGLEIVTEEDRHILFQTYVSLADLYIEYFPGDAETEEVANARSKVLQSIHDLYGEDALFTKVNSIICELVYKLGEPGSQESDIAEAIINLSNLSAGVKPEENVLIAKGFAQIIAIKITVEWLSSYTPEAIATDPIESRFINLVQQLYTTGFDSKVILDTFNEVEELQQNYAGDFKLYSEPLIKIYGIGLLTEPEATPALEPMQKRVSELLDPYIEEQFHNYTNEEIKNAQPKTANEITTELTTLIERDGFSEYALNKAIADWKQLPKETEEEYEIFSQGLLNLFDIGIQYGNEEVSATFKVGKEVYINNIELINSNPEPLSIEQIQNLSKNNLLELKHNLENGELPAVAITRALMTFQSFVTLMPEYDEKGEMIFKDIMNDMMKEFPEIIRNYTPEDKRAVWNETIKMMGILPEALDIQEGDETENAIMTKRFEEQGKRFINAGLHLPVSPEAASISYIKQFIDLYPGLASRFMYDDIDDNSFDKKEFDRLKTDLEDTFKLLSSAYSTDKFMEHQKIGLRRMSIELGQFERRRHLMIATPSFPVNRVTVDPNRVFFSGMGNTAMVVANACHSLGMVLSTKRSIANQLHSRWEQLRESGIAIFDYSNYNPEQSDPKKGESMAKEDETAFLQAAGPVAMVAYENGWAYVLGKPVIILVKKGQPVPFDIDLEPVVLEGDKGDEERIIAGIQIALYGVNRNTKGNCLPETIAHIKTVYKEYDDTKVQSMLQSLGKNMDATKARFTIDSILERIGGSNQMLITPVFPGSYPRQNNKIVFHITAFRSWSKPLQEVLNKICIKNGYEYRIGYQQLSPEILASIWADISQSSYVIADITNLNPNAVLELAMAQAFGCATLIVTQNTDPHLYFPPVQKVRTHYYNPHSPSPELTLLLERFFSGNA